MKTENGKLKKYKLGEIATITVGYPFESEKFNIEGKGVRLVRGMNVSERYLRFGEDSRWWSDLTDDLLPYYLKENDIVIGMDGSKVGRNFAIVNKNDLPLILVQRVACIRAKENFNQKFIWQYISSSRFLEYVNTIKTGSAIPHISGSQIADFPIFAPPLHIQQKIAAVLSTLDYKIALNRRMNTKLEQMAKRLYDHWFVQFDFPFDFACFDYAQQPKHTNLLVAERSRGYKSSGGKMVWNETLKREIPAGWEAIQIKDIATLERGISYSKENLVDTGTPMISLASFSPDSSYKENCIKYYQGDIDSCDYLNPYDVLMCTTQQTDIDNVTDIIGKCIVVPDVFREQAVFTTDLVKVKVEQNLGLIISCETKLPWYNKYITGFASGTSIKHLNTAGFLNYSIALPKDVDIINKFANIIMNFKRQQSVIMKETQKLTAMRDRLLPLLMNGQVEVK